MQTGEVGLQLPGARIDEGGVEVPAHEHRVRNAYEVGERCGKEGAKVLGGDDGYHSRFHVHVVLPVSVKREMKAGSRLERSPSTRITSTPERISWRTRSAGS